MSSEFERLTDIEWAVRRATEFPPEMLYGWLLCMAAQTFRNTNQLLEEIRRMATNDAALTQAVQDLLDAYQANTTALEAEISNLQSTGLQGADPAIAAAVNNIENIVAQMKQSTTNAQAALPASSDPTQASASAAAGTTDAAGTSSSPGGDLPAGGSSTTDAGSTASAGAAG